MAKRQNISSGTKWEAFAGYSRAVRVGNVVHVAGTTASDENSQIVGKGDAYAQAIYIFQKIENALNEAGADLRHVVRTRIYVTDIRLWEGPAKAHGVVFGDIRPANTLVEVSGLVTPDHLVEIEAEAIITED